jgi:hypothetical protein
MASFAGAHLSVSNNKIVGTFSKSLSGGNVYLYHAAGNSSTGNSMIESGNDFSNITLTGTTLMRGWYNNEGVSAAGPEKSIVNNVFENWICGTTGTGTTNAIYCNWASGNSEVSKNRIYNITAPASLNGILSASEDADSLAFNGNSLIDLKSIGNGYEIDMFKFSGISADINIINTFARGFGAVGSPSRYDGISLPFILPTYENIYVYYNTIYLDVSSTNTNFSTNGIYFASSTNPDECRLFLRNNIIVNVSQPNGTGVSSAFGRTGVSLANFDPSSNNNVFYAGPTPSAQHVVFSDGTNFEHTLNDYQTHLQTNGFPTSTEQASLWLLPEFVAPVATNPDLHLVLPSTANCLIKLGGDNNGILLTTDADGDYRQNSSPFITAIGADEVIKNNIFFGFIDTDWHNPGNWSLGVVPNGYDMNATILSNFPNPIITGTVQLNEILIGYADLTQNIGLLKIAGNLEVGLTLFNHDLVTGELVGSVEFNGYCNAQIIEPTVFLNNNINDLIVSNDLSISTSNLDLHGELSFGTSTNTTLTTNGNLTLVSNANRTANVAQITNSNVIAGEVTVERYIHTGTNPASGSIPAEHARSWQLLSTPTIGQTVRESWMEGMITGDDDLNPGYGTNIPGGSGTSDGFDQVPVTGDGIKWWDENGFPVPGFQDLSNTSVQLYNKRGYFLFVRGDRSVTTFPGTPVPTILRQKGEIFQPYAGSSLIPEVTTIPVLATPVAISVGNPYASAIDLNAMVSTGGFNNIGDYVIVYDPTLGSLGGYQYLEISSGFTLVTPGSNSTYYTLSNQYPYLQSGNAFFISSDPTGLAGSVTFTEAVKVNNHKLVNRPASIPITSSEQKLNAYLHLSNGSLADGNVVFYKTNCSNGSDANDVSKLYNFGENFMIERNGKHYAIEGRAAIEESDTIHYSFNNLAPQSYLLKFATNNFAKTELKALLIDSYTGIKKEISFEGETIVMFSVSKDERSFKNRFMVVFQKFSDENSSLSETISLTVFPNPVENNQINFTISNHDLGRYTVQVLDQSGHIVHEEYRNFEVANAKQTMLLRRNVSAGVYQLRIFNKKGFKTQRQVMIK